MVLYTAMRWRGRLRALSLCMIYKAVADDCWISLGAVAMMSMRVQHESVRSYMTMTICRASLDEPAR